MRTMMSLAAVAALWATAAQAGWRGAEWNMTPEEVAAALPEAKLVAKRTRELGKLIGNRGDYVDGKAKFRTTYYYDDKGLAVIGLDAPRKFNCVDHVRPLMSAYGDPVVLSDQVILRLVIWHDPKGANRIRLLTSPGGGICSLYYERLSDYEAIDKRPRQPSAATSSSSAAPIGCVVRRPSKSSRTGPTSRSCPPASTEPAATPLRQSCWTGPTSSS